MRVSRYLIGSGQQAPVSFRSSFPASEVLTESLLDTPTDDGGGFNDPSDLPEATHWWDASDETTITDNAGDITWEDKIGSADMTSRSTGTVTTGGTINGLNVLTVNGSSVDDGLSTVLPSEADFAVYMMASIDTVNATGDGLFSLDDTTTSASILCFANNASQFDGQINLTNGTNTGWTGGPFSGLVLFGLKVNATAGTVVVEIDGSPVATVNDYTATFPNGIEVFLAQVISSGATLGCRLCEAVWCNAVPADEATLEAYLTNKWTPAAANTWELVGGGNWELVGGGNWELV